MVASITYSLANIAISNIDIQDETYRISTPKGIDGLTASIRDVGLLNPPALKPKQGQYTIISGFQRIEAVHRLGIDTLPARLLSEDASPLDCIRLAISDNIVHRNLNLVEVSRCIIILSRTINDSARVTSEAQRLGVPGNSQFFQQVSQIDQFPKSVKAGLSEGKISLNIAMELQLFGHDSADLLVTLFRELKINQNKQKEICTHLKEIVARENQCVQTVMEDLGLADIMLESTLSNQQKTKAIRSQLHKRRFPHLWKAQENRLHALKQLKLDKTIQIQPPDYFEGTSFSLHLGFKTKNELKRHLTRLEQMLADPNLDQLLKR
jgi:ParB family chromosome partitioning protein